MVLASLWLGLAPPVKSLAALEPQLNGPSRGDFSFELVASCSGEGVMWERFALDLLRAVVAWRPNKLLTGLRALAGTSTLYRFSLYKAYVKCHWRSRCSIAESCFGLVLPWSLSLVRGPVWSSGVLCLLDLTMRGLRVQVLIHLGLVILLDELVCGCLNSRSRGVLLSCNGR